MTKSINRGTEYNNLDKECAYIKDTPISSNELMSEKLIHEFQDKEWNEWALTKFWHTDYEGFVPNVPPLYLEKLLELRDTILTFGGEQAILQLIEEDLLNLLKRGQFWYGDIAELILGLPVRCHENSAILWAESKKDKSAPTLHIATGYALSEDGLWRQHSWCVESGNGGNKPVIHETTELRIGYFGFVLTEGQANTFFDNNCL